MAEAPLHGRHGHRPAPRFQAWSAEHPRVNLVPIPTGVCRLNLLVGWWRLSRKEAFAGQGFAEADKIKGAVEVAEAQFNRHAEPCVGGRPPPAPSLLCVPALGNGARAGPRQG